MATWIGADADCLASPRDHCHCLGCLSTETARFVVDVVAVGCTADAEWAAAERTS